ncbi:MAG: AI-2E family transporter YdiK [Rubrivivax sp.]|jgi:predicted PurR-regulated permease PerM|nr:AI-2E family transporter YdiK [Rubrivivax sp.]
MAQHHQLPPRHGADIARTTFSVIAMVALVAACGWVMRPFLGPAVWATMVVVATWPVMLRVQSRLWNRRGLAVTVMSLLLLLLFVVPLMAAIVTIVGNADRLADWARIATTWRPPEQAPAWLVGLPMVGSTLAELWPRLADLGASDLLQKLTPYAGNLTRWFVAEVGGIGVLLVQFLATVAIAAVLYALGEDAAELARKLARRLAGDRGVGAVELAGGAIRGVALGVGVTAIVQAVMGGLGLAVAGVPFAGLLTAVMFMLCIAQVGPVPVLLPAAIWMFWQGDTAWGVALVVWSVVVGSLDNVLRPMLIRMGADLPLLLIFAGVIGGLFTFGLVGIFVGPVLLAVGWTLMDAWVSEDAGDPKGPASAPGPAPRDWRD